MLCYVNKNILCAAFKKVNLSATKFMQLNSRAESHLNLITQTELKN